jgi:hypothetical protein
MPGAKMKKVFTRKIIYEAILVFLMVVVGYGYFSTERDVNINSRLALVKAFVDEGRFEIDSYRNTELYTNDMAYFNGHYYSDKAIGGGVLGIFAYYPVRWIYVHEGIRLTPRLFREWLTFLAVSLPAALIAPFLYTLIKQITSSTTKSLIITLAISLGTSLYKYATGFYGHSLAAAYFFLAFLIWFYAKRDRTISLTLTFVSAFLLGFMVITEYPTVVLAFLLSLYILFTLYQSGQLSNLKIYAVMAAGFGIPICVLLYYNYSIYGTLFTTTYSHEYLQIWKDAHSNNFMGIGFPNLRVFFYETFHPSLGIFWQNPVLLLGIIGWYFMAKKEEYRVEFYFTICVIFLYVLFFSGYFDWFGGVAFTPRHLIPILPFFALPLAFLPQKFSIPLLIIGLISIFQNLLMAASGFEGLYEYKSALINGISIVGQKGMVFYEVCLPNIINGNLTNNRGIQLLHLQGPVSLLPLLFLEFGLLVVFFKLTQTESGL